MQSRDKYAIIVAAGKGIRMGNTIPKQYLRLKGRPVLYYSIYTFYEAFPGINIVLVHAAGDEDYVEQVVTYFPDKEITKVIGGETRFDSVKNGLQEISSTSVVFVHDGVRPLISSQLIHSCYQDAIKYGTAIPCLPIKESIRRLEQDRNSRVNRNDFKTVQTPQTFLSEIIIAAFYTPYEDSFTDEATVVEKSGYPIHLIDGEEKNIKITRPADLWLAEKFLEEKC
ncbi:MAG: 2-C-methyl-D-erythritol 4-phosphate cytidylyltransferase [Chitinophagaceae bacterium]